jgi:thiamine monophosphate kinase
MNEYEIIRSIAERFPRSADQHNQPFTCDAEIVQIDGKLWGFTMDDFSPEEDMFSSDNPESLGANLVTATLSDLLAAGVEPKFFMQALSLPKKADAGMVRGLTDGIKLILDKAGCSLCGGDIGTAETWRYCGFAMGPVTGSDPLTHILPKQPQKLWITGELGDANLAALQKRATPIFELRIEEAKHIRHCATACIDTSSGFLDCVWLLHTLNTDIRIDIDCDDLPLSRGIAEFAKASGVPAEAALLGGAGEYELLFATPAELEDSQVDSLKDAGMTHIGTAELHEEPGVFMRRAGKNVGRMTEPPPCAREAEDVQQHIQEVIQSAQRIFGKRSQYE